MDANFRGLSDVALQGKFNKFLRGIISVNRMQGISNVLILINFRNFRSGYRSYFENSASSGM